MVQPRVRSRSVESGEGSSVIVPNYHGDAIVRIAPNTDSFSQTPARCFLMRWPLRAENSMRPTLVTPRLRASPRATRPCCSPTQVHLGLVSYGADKPQGCATAEGLGRVAIHFEIFPSGDQSLVALQVSPHGTKRSVPEPCPAYLQAFPSSSSTLSIESASEVIPEVS